MAKDYSPLFQPGDVIPLTAGGTIAAGDLVGVSASGQVSKVSALQARTWIGVAANAAAATERVTVFARGPVHESVADGTVTAGDEIGTTNTANRQVKTIPATATTFAGTYSAADAKAVVDAAINSARAVVGIALTTAADNATVRWMQV